MATKLLLALLAAAGVAHPQLQTGRVSTDYFARTVLFESGGTLAGEEPRTGERILVTTGGQTAVTATGVPTQIRHGVINPMTNDHGHLRAFTLWDQPVGGGHFTGGLLPYRYFGVVRHDEDGWEVRRDGRVILSRDGRWAVFSGSDPARTLWLDLWLDEEFVIDGLQIFTQRIDDEGALVYPSGRNLVLQRPHAEPVLFPLPFDAQDAIIDRTGGWAAVRGSGGIYRLSLITGTLEPWMTPCPSCFLSDITGHGTAILYQEWNSVVITYGPGAGIQWLNNVDGATFNGAGTAVIATTTEGVVRFDLATAESEMLTPGPVALSNPPEELAPGLWLRSEGRGLSTAETTLNGERLEPLDRGPSRLEWAVPTYASTGEAELRIGQPDSPFEPLTLQLPVRQAVPVFIVDLEFGAFSRPQILHAADGSSVSGLSPARPGESILVMMTGLNGLAAAVQWSISLEDEEYFPVFESAEPAAENPYWTSVRLRMPETLPDRASVLTADLNGIRYSALLATRSY